MHSNCNRATVVVDQLKIIYNPGKYLIKLLMQQQSAEKCQDHKRQSEQLKCGKQQTAEHNNAAANNVRIY